MREIDAERPSSKLANCPHVTQQSPRQECDTYPERASHYVLTCKGA